MRGLVLLTLLGMACGGAVELTDSSFDDAVFKSGKNSFVKFLAPWWGHCKSMKPAWDRLGEEYKDSSSVLIADVDCTVEKDVCSNNDVSGYPTIKYYKDGSKEGESYSGGRDFDSLKKFTAENLEVLCDANAPADCTDKEKAFITKMKEKGSEAIKKQKARLGGWITSGKKMKAELKQWVVQRLNILKQLDESAVKEEL